MKPLLLGFTFVMISSPVWAQWQKQDIKTDADFRGLCAVSAKVAWVSGTKGTFGRTIDGGQTWTVGTITGADRFDFRDIEAFNENTAYALSIGLGEDSQIYKTVDGGKIWRLQFRNKDPDAFYDAIAFWDENTGIAVSDPTRGFNQFQITKNGGVDWREANKNTLLPALEKEGAFAASGTCLVTHGAADVWFATGGAKVSRVFHSGNKGESWTVCETPIAANVESAGIFSIGFKDKDQGMIVGGNYKKPKETGMTAAITSDGGKTWKAIANQLPFRSGVAWAKDRWVAVGTTGSNQSSDGGITWKELDTENYNSVSFTKTGEGWAAGPKGRVAKWVGK